MKQIYRDGICHIKGKISYPGWLSRWLPRYAIFSLPACLLVNLVIYSGCQILTVGAAHLDWTMAWDDAIPFVPEWVFIYLGSYLFWAANYLLMARLGKEAWYRFAAADMASRVVCGICFLLFPVSNVRPEVAGTGLASWLMRVVYAVDAPVNLFPSIHCLVSWLCYIGIRGCRKVPLAYRGFSLVMALLICASTQFTKQHILLDLAGGILLAEVSLGISRRCDGYLTVMRFFDRLEEYIFGGEGESIHEE